MELPPPPDPSALRVYLGVIRRRLSVIVLVIVIVTAAALAQSLREKPVYEATAQVLLQPRLSEQLLQNQQVTPSGSQADTEIQLMQSKKVVDAVTKALGHAPTITLLKAGTTDVVGITASSGTGAGAANDANTYAQTYADTRRQGVINDLSDASVELQKRLTDIDGQLQTLDKSLVDLDGQILAAAPAARPALQAQRTTLADQVQSQRASLSTRRNAYADQLDRLQVATNLTVTGGAQVASPATEPTAPVSPKPLRNGAVALGIGAIIGLGLAFLLEQLDDRVRSKEQLETAAGGLTTVGLIPSVIGWRKHREHEIISSGSDTTAAAEAYRSLRTAVQFIGIEHPAQIIQITSALSAEGKTTTVANLGITLARAGKRVILVDSDLRRPRLHDLFGLSKKAGLTSVLLGERSLATAIMPVPDERRLALLPSGEVPPNPSELLALRTYANLIETLKSECDYVIIDTPPVLPVTDALIVSSVADITFLVAQADSSNHKDVRRAVELLRQVDAPLMGSILNNIPTRGRYGYRYGYSYRYGESPNDREAPVPSARDEHERAWPDVPAKPSKTDPTERQASTRNS